MLSLLKLQASLTTDLCIEPPVGLPVKTSDDLTALETYLMEPGNFSDMVGRLGVVSLCCESDCRRFTCQDWEDRP